MKEKEESNLSKALLLPFRLLNQGIEILNNPTNKLFRVVFTILGFLISFVGFILFFIIHIVFFVVFTVFLGAESTSNFEFYMDPNTEIIFNYLVDMEYLWMPLCLGYVVAVIPTILFILLGVSFVKERSVFRPVFTWILIILWFLGLLGMSYYIGAFCLDNYKYHETVFYPIG